MISIRIISSGVIALAMAAALEPASARDAIEDAMDTAEVYVYGRESRNEALLEEISDPRAYAKMAKERSESDAALNENVRVEDVEITRVDGDRAVARATYSQKHTGVTGQADVHLQRVDGKWQVTTPPKSGE